MSTNCEVPSFSTVIPAIITLAPGFLCLIFFFLLFLNKDCRQIWKNYYQRISRLFTQCSPPAKLRSNTDRSRCSSTLTVLSERRGSRTGSQNFVLELPIDRKPRSASDFRLPLDSADFVLRIQLTPSLSEGRPRCLSSPTKLQNSAENYDIVRNFAISIPHLRENTPVNKHSLQLSVDLTETQSQRGSQSAGTRENVVQETDEQLTRL